MTAVADTLQRRQVGDRGRSHVLSSARDEAASLAATTSPKVSPSPGGNQNLKFLYEPGSSPLPRYTIRRGLGVGGFGEVYFAVSEAGKEVALKRIQRNLEVELRGVSQCLNLKHPNLVALYDICRDDADQAWVVMEYVAGKNLREILDENPNGLEEPEARRWFAELCAGVNHLHQAGLVHRDLKPGNIFNDMGVVKVGDYGLSKFISASHRGGHTESVGTFHYMAPEIGRGIYGREIDIYALGVILFELLTGRVPFDGESCHEIIVKHLTALPDLTGVQSPYRNAIEAALHKDPNRRPSSVTELLTLLDMSKGSSVVYTAKLADAPEPTEHTAATESASRPVYPAALDPSAGRVAPPAQSTETPNLVPVNEEPIARAVRQSVKQAWGTLERSPGAKTAILVIGTIALVLNSGLLFPLLSMIGVFYVPYYIIRNMVLHVRQQPTYAQAQRIADTHARPAKPLTRKQWCGKMRNSLRAKHSTTRLAELGTSSIVAILTSMFLVLVAGVIGLRRGPVGAIEVAPYGFLAVVGMLSSLALLLMGKLWEREEGESLRRRIALAGLGAGIGLAAFGLGQHLMIPLDAGLHRVVDSSSLPQALYRHDGMPRASAYMAHFALLLAGLRWWWRMVDPLRRRRLSLWAVSVAVVGEWLIHQILPVAQPAGMVLAGGIAIVVQMSAPWVNPELEMPMETERPSTPPVTDMAAAGAGKANA